LDLAIGAGGAEQIIVANMTASSGTGSVSRASNYFFPVSIPAGTRLSVKVQSVGASQVLRTSVVLLKNGFLASSPLSRITTYGADTSDSGGVSIVPDTGAGTKGVWAVIDAATANPMRGFVLGLGNGVNTARTTTTWMIDVGVGGAGSEVVVISDLMACAGSTEDTVTPIAFPFIPCSIPAGVRLVVRASCQTADATDKLLDAIIYGVD
jgi:hypothetical protein